MRSRSMCGAAMSFLSAVCSLYPVSMLKNAEASSPISGRQVIRPWSV